MSGGTSPVPLAAAGVLRRRAAVSHLDRKLPPRAYADAAWAGLQDSIPRGGLASLHARVEATRPDAWEDPSLVQIWFRRGADYLVPRRDAGIFTLGSYPRDQEVAQALERVADEIHRICDGRMLPAGEVDARLRSGGPFAERHASVTGRIHIRWDARRTWVIPVDRPDLDPEDARRALARRFLHWYGPSTVEQLARWTGVELAEAAVTWAGLADELVPATVAGRPGFVLRQDVDEFRRPPAVAGVRLVPRDDPFTRFDAELLVGDPDRRRRVLPRTGESPGYIPGAILAHGEVVGAWQRQQGRIRLHLFRRIDADDLAALEAEARAMPIPGVREMRVEWDPAAGRRPGSG